MVVAVAKRAVGTKLRGFCFALYCIVLFGSLGAAIFMFATTINCGAEHDLGLEGACLQNNDLASVLCSGVDDPEESHVLRLFRDEGSGARTVVEAMEGDLVACLGQEGHPLRAVQCGGGHPVHARREQWTDGANYVALGPGVVVGYARNTHTAREMSSAGFRVVSPEGFLREFRRDFGADPDALFDSTRRYAIHLQGSELSRGRGGPRCLTMPVVRD